MDKLKVERSYSYGRHPFVWDETVLLKRSTIDRWVRRWRARAKVEAFTSVQDNRNADGIGSVELHYYFHGVPNARRMDIMEAD
jgi:hypothetical protein